MFFKKIKKLEILRNEKIVKNYQELEETMIKNVNTKKENIFLIMQIKNLNTNLLTNLFILGKSK